MPFTETSAWALIALLIEDGHPIEEIELEMPPGAKGFVLLVDLVDDSNTLYIKLQLGGNGIFCRSFHYSNRVGRHGTPWPRKEECES